MAATQSPIPGAAPPPTLGDNHTDFGEAPGIDIEWSEDHWRRLIDWLIDTGFVSAKEIGALVLGHLNPSQVGTSIASKKTFQAHYPHRQTMKAVLAWHIEQIGRCADCGSRLELQADHVESREQYGDAADRLENMTLSSTLVVLSLVLGVLVKG
ncbi:MAG TPA: hypothetical protein VN892_13455 [Solirubrobacteraceae bacterium]|nr:hypothetical protein [Solirubrobacteraceae bacterium]